MIFIAVIISHIKGIFMKKMNVWLNSVYSLLANSKVIAAVALIIALSVTMPPSK
jgi:hypothetical protein